MKNTRKIKRQQVRETVAEISPWDLSGSAERIYKELQETEKYYLDKYDNVIDSGWGWESGVYDSSEGHFTFVITRLENDREYNARVKKLTQIKENEKNAKNKKNQAEYEEYLRLKKKFGDNYLHRKFDDKEWSKP